jgi:tetratricopeptide (TPR) repeat protein
MYYNKALKKNDKYAVLVFNLGILKLAQNKVPEAIDFFTKCLEMKDTLQSCNYGLMKAYFLNNQPEPAS